MVWYVIWSDRHGHFEIPVSSLREDIDGEKAIGMYCCRIDTGRLSNLPALSKVTGLQRSSSISARYGNSQKPFRQRAGTLNVERNVWEDRCLVSTFYRLCATKSLSKSTQRKHGVHCIEGHGVNIFVLACNTAVRIPKVCLLQGYSTAAPATRGSRDRATRS